MVKDFVDCKHGRKPIEKMHPLVDEMLKPTYGVIVYQEQVMQIAQKLAGYSLGGADLLRRAMGKKKPEEMAKQKATFVDGAGLGVRPEARGRRDLRPARVLRGLRLQQEPLGRVRAHHLPDGLPEGALPGRVPLRADDRRPRQDRQGRAHHRRGARRRRSTSVDRFHGRLRAERAVEGQRERARSSTRFRRSASASAPSAASGSPICSTSRSASILAASTRACFESLVQCGAFDATLSKRGVSAARARSRRSTRRSSVRAAASKDRERGQTSLFGLFDRAAPENPQRLADYPEPSPGICARRSCARSSPSASTCPVTRSIATASSSGASTCRPRARWRAWIRGRRCASRAWSRATASASSRAAVARSRSSSLEDTRGRVEVKVRQQQIETYGASSRAASPCSSPAR
jgi:DNA polymerase-3 subunit alpha